MIKKKSVFTIYLLGPCLTGKTYIFQKYLNKLDKPFFLASIGFDSKSKLINLDENTKIKLIIYDTSGTERFRGLNFNFIRNKCDGIIFVYSINHTLLMNYLMVL